MLQRIIGGGSGATNGLASSLVMSHSQGMELINPDLLEKKVKEIQGKDTYFSSKSGFSTVVNMRSKASGGQ
jgi:hypothetical protein